MATDYNEPSGWLAELLMNINQPARLTFDDDTFARGMMDVGAGFTGAPNTWFTLADYWTNEDGHEISNETTMWEAGRHFFQTGINDDMDEAVWKYVAPAVVNYYYGPAAGAATSYVGNRLSGEKNDTAITSAITTYAAGSILQEVGISSDGENSISNIWNGEGSWDFMSDSTVWRQLLNMLNNGLDSGKGNGSNYGTNEWSHVLGKAGAAIAPENPWANAGSELAQQAQYAKAVAAKEQERQQLTNQRMNMMMSESSQLPDLTVPGVPGPTAVTYTKKPDGSTVKKTEENIPDNPVTVHVDRDTKQIVVKSADGTAVPQDKWDTRTQQMVSAASAQHYAEFGSFPVNYQSPSDPNAGTTSLVSTILKGTGSTADLSPTPEQAEKSPTTDQFDSSANWILTPQQQDQIAQMGVQNDQMRIQIAQEVAQMRRQYGDRVADAAIRDMKMRLLELQIRNADWQGAEWVHPGGDTSKLEKRKRGELESGDIPATKQVGQLTENQKAQMMEDVHKLRTRINANKHMEQKGTKTLFKNGISPTDVKYHNEMQAKIGGNEFVIVNGSTGGVGIGKLKQLPDGYTITQLYERSGYDIDSTLMWLIKQGYIDIQAQEDLEVQK